MLRLQTNSGGKELRVSIVRLGSLDLALLRILNDEYAESERYLIPAQIGKFGDAVRGRG